MCGRMSLLLVFVLAIGGMVLGTAGVWAADWFDHPAALAESEGSEVWAGYALGATSYPWVGWLGGSQASDDLQGTPGALEEQRVEETRTTRARLIEGYNQFPGFTLAYRFSQGSDEFRYEYLDHDGATALDETDESRLTDTATTVGLAAAKRFSFGSAGLAVQHVSGTYSGSHHYEDETTDTVGSFTLPAGTLSSWLVTGGVTLPTGTGITLTRERGEIERTFPTWFSMDAFLATDAHDTQATICRVEQELWGHHAAVEYADISGSGTVSSAAYSWDGTNRVREPGDDVSADLTLASPRWRLSVSRALGEDTKLTAGYSQATERFGSSWDDTSQSTRESLLWRSETHLYSGRMDHRFSDRFRAAAELGYRVTSLTFDSDSVDYSVDPNQYITILAYRGPYRTVDASLEVEYRLTGKWTLTAAAAHSTVFPFDLALANRDYIGERTGLTIGASLAF